MWMDPRSDSEVPELWRGSAPLEKCSKEAEGVQGVSFFGDTLQS